MAWRRSLVATVLFLSGCAAAPGPSPAVTVHVLNGTSNVVMTSTGLHLVSSPAPGEDGYVEPCGGRVDVAAPNKNGQGGMLYLLVDPTARLDAEYAAGGRDAISSSTYEGSIIWSGGELKSGDWVTIASDKVTVTPTAPAVAASCAPWIYREPTP